MANYYCNSRSNYFHVKDPEAFKAFFKTVHGCEENPCLWEEPQKDGSVMFGFGCYGGIAGVAVPPVGRIEVKESADAEPAYTIDIFFPFSFECHAKQVASAGKQFSIVLYRDKEGNSVQLPYDFYLLGPSPLSITVEDAIEANEEDPYDVEYDFDAFLDGLQSHVADGDAVIIIESGHEKLSYVTGYAYVVTSEDIESLNLQELAIRKAAEMLKNPDYWTQCEY